MGGKQYVPFICSRDMTEARNCVELSPVRYEGKILAEDNREIISTSIARRIKRLLSEDRECTPGDILILMRGKKWIPFFQRALSIEELPFQIVGGVGLAEAEEVNECLSMLHFLFEPKDKLKAFTVLRSPLIGFSDSMLLRFNQVYVKQEGKLLDALKNFSSSIDEEQMVINRAYNILSSLLDKRQQLPASKLICHFLERSSAWLIYSAMPDGYQRIANLEELIQKAIELEQNGISSLAEFTTLLKESCQEQGEASLKPEETDRIRIMTIHAAKGLEAKYVFLPLWRTKAKSSGKGYLIENKPRTFALRYFDPHKNQYLEEEYKKACDIRKQKEEQEEKRLLYVALTRACDGLFIYYPEKLILKDIPEIGPRIVSLEKGKESIPGVIVKDLDADEIIIDEAEEKAKLYTHYRTSLENIEPAGKRDIPEIRLSEEVIEINASDLVAFATCPYSFYLKDKIPRETNSSAMGFGSLVHLLCSVDSTLSDRELIKVLCRRLEMEPTESLINKAIRALENYRNSDIKLMENEARKVYREFPITYQKNDIKIKGRVDLLIEDKEGNTYICDFKTDRIRGKEDVLRRKVDKYKLQLWIYVKAFPQKNPTPSLFFTDIGKLEWVSLQNIDKNLDELTDSLVKAIRENKYQAIPGDWCKECIVKKECIYQQKL